MQTLLENKVLKTLTTGEIWVSFIPLRCMVLVRQGSVASLWIKHVFFWKKKILSINIALNIWSLPELLPIVEAFSGQRYDLTKAASFYSAAWRFLLIMTWQHYIPIFFHFDEIGHFNVDDLRDLRNSCWQPTVRDLLSFFFSFLVEVQQIMNWAINLLVDIGLFSNHWKGFMWRR